MHFALQPQICYSRPETNSETIFPSEESNPSKGSMLILDEDDLMSHQEIPQPETQQYFDENENDDDDDDNEMNDAVIDDEEKIDDEELQVRSFGLDLDIGSSTPEQSDLPVAKKLEQIPSPAPLLRKSNSFRLKAIRNPNGNRSNKIDGGRNTMSV